MAGPWFAVLEEGKGWRELDRFWLSNGQSQELARIEIRISWEEFSDDV